MSRHICLLIVFVFSLAQLLRAQDFDDLNNQAYKERDNKNYQKAIELCTESINKKTNPRAYIIRGDCRYTLLDYEAAEGDFSSALLYYSDYYSDNKEKAGIYYMRGYCRLEMKRYSDAVSDFDNAIYYDYSKPGYVYWDRAICYNNLGKYKESEADYAKAIDRFSDAADLSLIYKRRGDNQADLGEIETALTYYARAISYNPRNSNAYWQRGYYKNFQGKYDEAIQDYDKAIEIISASDKATKNKDLSSLYRNQALIYNYQGLYEQALEAIDKAIKAVPNKIEAYETRAGIQWSLKRYDKAKADYDAAISLEKDKKKKANIYFNRSMKLWYILDYTGTMNDLNKAIELDPTDGMKYWHRALVYGYKKNYPLAIKECNTALEFYRKDSSSTASLISLRAEYNEYAGNNEAALSDYRTYVDYYPNSIRGYYNLGRFFKTRMKNNDLANANLTKAEELADKFKDTTMFCYINVFKGEKELAVKTMLQWLEDTKTQKGYDPDELHNMCCIYALIGNSGKAFEYLDKSLVAGYTGYLHLANDRDLVSLMKLPQWKTILAKHKVPSPK
jgi:tetratricopeptide (TPR) repeat protein